MLASTVDVFYLEPEADEDGCKRRLITLAHYACFWWIKSLRGQSGGQDWFFLRVLNWLSGTREPLVALLADVMTTNHITSWVLLEVTMRKGS